MEIVFFCVLISSGLATWFSWKVIRREEREELAAKRKAADNPYAPPMLDPSRPGPRVDNRDLDELIEKARRQLAE